jgi:hypothetical protein
VFCKIFKDCFAPTLKLGEKLCFAKFSKIVLKPTLKLGEKLEHNG